MKKNDDLIEIPKNDRKRSFFIVLYEDSTSYDINKIFFELNGFKEYAYIRHEPESNEKKAHFHLYIHLPNACTIDSISKRLGIPKNHIQFVNSQRACLRYLTHIDYPEKKQYNIADIVCSKSLERDLLKSFDDIESESDIIDNIYHFIDSLPNEYNYYQGLRELTKFININYYDTIYKRYRSEFHEYMSHLY